LDYARPNPRIFPRIDDWNESWDVGVAASWALFDGGRARADAAGADAMQRALRKQLDEFDSLLDVEIRQRSFDLDSSRARARAADDAVRSAAEARRVLQDRYAAGVATSTETLDAQVVQLEAELQRTRALTAVRLAEAALERALGR
jgi:OMF family outer membrane factor